MVDISVPELSVGILLLVMLFMRYITAQLGSNIWLLAYGCAPDPIDPLPEGMVLIRNEEIAGALTLSIILDWNYHSKFWMGSEDVNSDSDERPVHRVRLRWFFDGAVVSGISRRRSRERTIHTRIRNVAEGRDG